MKPITLMAHLVANYPDPEGCLAAAEALAEAGTKYFEVQIPFSDPSADGKSIMTACSAALAAGFSVSDAFRLVDELKRRYPEIPVFVMAYANLVASPGVETFVHKAGKAGVRALIVPDLPFDCDEGLAAACAAYASSAHSAHNGTSAGSTEGPISAVPVAAPSMSRQRLMTMAALGRSYLYAALRTGITGQATEISESTKEFLSLCASGGSKVLGGFGIRSHAQALQVADHVHAVVAGSVFVDAIADAVEAHRVVRSGSFQGSSRVRNEAIRSLVRERAQEIIGG
ncbi:tryptophan synthase subunit alpha [Gracilinema caldarium]|uniref:tryptophan synthase subunit alpha n=1 Tax=Gracilinema caldarium TaxID=215591 RepID=UPI0026F378FA|nr:tryptophan synthase subunit alpha [Gracilinema caldarium]